MAIRSCRQVWVGLLGVVMWVGVPAGAGPVRAVVGADTAPDVAGVDVARLDAVGVASALEALDGCVRRLNPDIDVGYDRIVVRCPILARRLEEAGVAVWLPRDWQRPGNDLSSGGLRALRELLLHELPVAPVPGARRPGTQSVPEILAGLTRADDAHSGWWARTRAWLRALFAGRDATGEAGWLGRMMGQSGVSQAVLELVSYGALALVVVLAVGIVVNEMWVGGVWRGRRRRRGAEGSGLGRDWVVAEGVVRLDWAGVVGAPVERRLGLLLELVVARLGETVEVRLSRGLTARELLAAAPLADARDRERLAALVRASERVRYAGGEVAEEQVAQVMEEGRLLLERISAGVSGRGVGA